MPPSFAPSPGSPLPEGKCSPAEFWHSRQHSVCGSASRLPDRLVWADNGSLTRTTLILLTPMKVPCSHREQMQDVQPQTQGCEDCLASGDRWVHLRLCLTCGHVGCCDSSKNKHATRHFHTTGHPLIRSLEPGESWVWCYVDQTVV
jgi:hypothetical protein